MMGLPILVPAQAQVQAQVQAQAQALVQLSQAETQIVKRCNEMTRSDYHTGWSFNMLKVAVTQSHRILSVGLGFMPEA
jgi:cell division protein FtsB